MAHKRTKQEKMVATLRRKLEKNEHKKEARNEAQTKHESINTPVTKPIFYVPEHAISTKLLAGDLTKSLAVTILALILQFSLASYLNHGGWQIINNMLQKFASSF